MTVHHVYACRSNVGDWLSARGVQSVLSPLEMVEHLCDEPFADETLRALSGLQAGDVVVVGGGGLLMDYFRDFWEGVLELPAEVPLFVWGVGACDHKRQSSTLQGRLLRAVVERSRLFVARDDLTRDLIGERAVLGPVACPAVVAAPSPPDTGLGVLCVAHRYLLGDSTDRYVRRVSRDLAAATDRPYDEIDNRIPPDDLGALADVVKRYEAADVIVSSRLHGCVIGLAMGRRVVAVSGDRKIDSFMSAAGLRDWVCEVDDERGLRDRMARVEEQPSAAAFVEASRRDNAGIGERVKAIVRDLDPGARELEPEGERR